MSTAAMVQVGDVPDPTVRNHLEQDTLKWIFVGGMGGVGKTICSSIVSICVCQSVSVISSDPVLHPQGRLPAVLHQVLHPRQGLLQPLHQGEGSRENDRLKE
uniref:Anion-transporting ATPase-like domain-containing protein n=1 Tax=Triticum urartu TaxID=4572 RepID=A0A8R7QCT6_TRIUA